MILKDALRNILFRYISLTTYVSDLFISKIKYFTKQLKGLHWLSLSLRSIGGEDMVVASSMVKGICSLDSFTHILVEQEERRRQEVVLGYKVSYPLSR